MNYLTVQVLVCAKDISVDTPCDRALQVIVVSSRVVGQDVCRCYLLTGSLGVIEYLLSNHRGKGAADGLFPARSKLHNTSSTSDKIRGLARKCTI